MKSTKKMVLAVSLILIFLLSLGLSEVFAATITKANNTTDLNVGTSWTGDAAPGSSDTASWTNTVTGDNTTSLGADTSWQGISIASPGGNVTINAGNTLTLGTGGINMSSATKNLTIGSAVVLGGDQTFNVAYQKNLTMSGSIGGTNNLIFNGQGKLIMSGSGSNTYTGTTTIQNGSTGGADWSGGLYLGKTGGAVAIAGNVTFYNDGSNNLRMQADNQFGSNSVITWVDSANVGAGRFDLLGTSQTVAGISETGTGDGNHIGVIQNRGLFGGDVTSNATLTINVASGSSYTYSGIIRDEDAFATAFVLNIVKTGGGTQTISGAADYVKYTGTTTINGGTLRFAKQTALYNNTPASWTAANIIVGSGGTLALNVGGAGEFTSGNVTTILTNLGGLGGAVNNNGLQSGSAIAFDTTNAAGGTFTVSNNMADSTGTGGGAIGLTKLGTGTLTLSGTNTYTGTTTVNAGTLGLSGSAAIADTGAVSLADTLGASLLLNASETIGSLSGGGDTGGGVNLGTRTLTVSGTATTTYSGQMTGTNLTCLLAKTGTGSLTLAGATDNLNTSVSVGGGTLILAKTTANATAHATVNGGTLRLGGTNDCQIWNGGTVTVNGGTFDINTHSETVDKYIQAAGSTLAVALASASTSGKLSYVTGAGTTVDTGSTVAVTVPSNLYIPTGSTFTVIDGTGGTIGVPGTITSSNSHIAFTGSASNGDLILTVNRSTTGFASDATDSNGRAVGTVLDNITNPSSDMTTVLNTMEGLSDSQVASALDAMDPSVDSGTYNNSTAMLENFNGVAIERVRDVLRLAQNPSVGAGTGVSAGDGELLNGIWGKGYGSYLDQGTRKGIQGYTAWNAGTALGIDRLFADIATIGISGGWAYGNVDSDANNGNTYINSAQTTLYAGYRNDTYPFYIDASGSFAWNWYNGKRDIAVGAINRTANASYDGQQYGAYVGGGYDFLVYKEVNLTPLLSLQWMHLHLQSYTETEAGALNLNVASQDYDILQSGVGASVSGPIEFKWGKLIPEVHGRWLYDFFGETVVMTSTFTGGGASFNADGFKPAQNSFNIGGKLGIDLKNNISILVECDTELKDEFWGIYGAGTVRYTF